MLNTRNIIIAIAIGMGIIVLPFIGYFIGAWNVGQDSVPILVENGDEEYVDSSISEFVEYNIQYDTNSFNDDVEKIQIRLNDLDYEIEVDGYFGSETESAIIEFQKNNGLEADGVVEQSTWETLFYSDDPKKKIIQPAFISVPSVDKYKRADNNAYYIYGSTSDNCEKVIATASVPNVAIVDSYQLTNYKKGDTTFAYGIREDWGNLGVGANVYTFTAYCEGGQIKTANSTLEYTITYTPPVPTYTPPVPTYTPPVPTYTPPIPTGVIETKIEGEFEGWDGETIFLLDNGQIWQQSSYDYTYHYAYRPDVLIYKSGGEYKMKVEEVDDTISVIRLK
jgi:peptidoglycan hydrolase-like protein with peptidoglycan-binding domain